MALEGRDDKYWGGGMFYHAYVIIYIFRVVFKEREITQRLVGITWKQHDL